MTAPIATVARVTGPHFCADRAEHTGHGWIVGACRVVYADGSSAVHQHYAFDTEAEAQECAKELRGKMQ